MTIWAHQNRGHLGVAGHMPEKGGNRPPVIGHVPDPETGAKQGGFFNAVETIGGVVTKAVWVNPDNMVASASDIAQLANTVLEP